MMSLKNAQYNAVMRQYDLRQQQAIADQTERRNEIYAKLPAFAKIDSQIASFAAARARAAISGHPISKEALHEQLEQFNLEKARLLQSAGYPADYLDPIYHCPDCKDTGFIGTKKCHCFKQAVVDLVYAQSNIKEKLTEENFDVFDLSYYSTQKDSRMDISPRENMEQVLNQCMHFIKYFDTEFSNLLFYGNTGVGKTFLSNCIAKELLDSAHTVIYQSALSLVQLLEDFAFHRSEDDYADSEDMYSYILDCDLLIIDDLGTELTNAFTTSRLFSCLNERLLRKKSTIISTNLSLDELQDIYSERIFSRLISNYQVTLILGDDIRVQKAIS